MAVWCTPIILASLPCDPAIFIATEIGVDTVFMLYIITCRIYKSQYWWYLLNTARKHIILL